MAKKNKNLDLMPSKKEKMGEYEHEDILLVVQAEIEYSEQIEEEE